MSARAGAPYKVVVTEPLPPESLTALYEGAEVTAFPRSPEMDQLMEALQDADGLIVRSGTRVTREVLAGAPRLRVIGRAGVGVDNIDLEACTERGIFVVNVADGNSVAVAEHAFALMLSLLRRVVAAHQSLAAGKWERSRFVGEELRGKTLGLVGFGRVGSEVARRALVFGMKVLGFDPYVTASRFQAMGVQQMELPELLANADIVSLHIPRTPETRHIIDAQALATMKPGSYIINCARGGLIDEEALAKALQEGRLAGAALDVFETEPPGQHPLAELPNVVLTPHLGGSTQQALNYIAASVADQVIRLLRGEPARGVVNLPYLSDEDWRAIGPLVPMAETLGLIYREGLGGPMEKVEVVVRAADLPSARAVEILTGAVLKGMLEGIVQDPVNLVNAPLLAGRRGLEVQQRTETAREAPGPVISVASVTEPRRSVAATLSVDGTIRLTNLDGLPIDMVPGHCLLLTRHQDRPGMIGRVGSILGRHGVNIAAMQVARREVRGEAIMVLALDDPVPSEVLAELRGTENMVETRSVTLPHLNSGHGNGAADKD